MMFLLGLRDIPGQARKYGLLVPQARIFQVRDYTDVMVNLAMAVVLFIGAVFFGVRAANDFGYKLAFKVPLSFVEFSKEKDVVALSPSSFELSPKWASIQEIRVTNTSSIPIFQVQLKLTLEKGDTDVTKISLLPLKKEMLSQPLDNSKDTYVVGLDYFSISGNDSNGRPATHFFIRALDPNETITFKLSIHSGAIKTASTISVKVTDFSREQPRVLYKPGQVAMPFKWMD